MLLIDNDEVAEQVMALMQSAGVPIVTEEPAGENELERQVNEMLHSGKSAREINAVIRAYEGYRRNKN